MTRAQLDRLRIDCQDGHLCSPEKALALLDIIDRWEPVMRAAREGCIGESPDPFLIARAECWMLDGLPNEPQGVENGRLPSAQHLVELVQQQGALAVNWTASGAMYSATLAEVLLGTACRWANTSLRETINNAIQMQQPMDEPCA